MSEQVCTVDIESTGLDSAKHEIIEMAFLPANKDFKPDIQIEPFAIQIRAENYKNISQEALKINNLNPADGVSRDMAKHRFYIWMRKYGITKIELLGQNVKFDISFLTSFLSFEVYNELFHYHTRDTMSTAKHINDKEEYNLRAKMFSDCKLKTIAKKLDVDYSGAHRALQDCIITLECYRKMLEL